MTLRRFLVFLVPIVTLPGALGCGSSDKWVSARPKVVPVNGRVLYKGQALAGAHVTFMNTTAGRSGYGTTDADGRFTLTTFVSFDGAVPGKQQISVSKVEFSKALDPGVDRTTTTKPSSEPVRRWLIPERYGDVKTSGLTAEVTENGPNDIVLELKGS